MRIDARYNPEAWRWSVWHVERCERLQNVVWADDETAQYGQYPLPFTGEIRVHQARRIRFAFENQVVLINPLDDATMIESEVEEVKRDRRIYV